MQAKSGRSTKRSVELVENDVETAILNEEDENMLDNSLNVEPVASTASHSSASLPRAQVQEFKRLPFRDVDSGLCRNSFPGYRQQAHASPFMQESAGLMQDPLAMDSTSYM